MSSLLLKESISFLHVLRLGFLKAFIRQAAGFPTRQVEFKGTSIMVFGYLSERNLLIINRKENTWIGSQI